ncbi:Uncharacterized protein ToN1_44610 [Aromatoleum petrolei]|nr:Uncharacterized protein ToN1_44610 [Aromatoleum petrolei]
MPSSAGTMPLCDEACSEAKKTRVSPPHRPRKSSAGTGTDRIESGERRARNALGRQARGNGTSVSPVGRPRVSRLGMRRHAGALFFLVRHADRAIYL